MASTALEQQPYLEERKNHGPVDAIDEKRDLSASEEGSVRHKEHEEAYDGFDT
jgi:hypothetical protein